MALFASFQGAVILNIPYSFPDRSWPPTTLLAGLSLTARKAILSVGTEIEQPGGRVILRQGAKERHAYLLLNGMVKVVATTADGHEALLGIRVGGDLVGEMGALEGCGRSATVITCWPLVVRVIHDNELTDLMSRYPDIAIGITKMISARLRWANRRRVDFTAHNPQRRVCRVLTELMTDHGMWRDDRWVLGVPLTQPELASLAGIKLRTVEKELRRLQDQGIVECRYRQISIIDIEKLRLIASEPESRI